MYLCLILTLRVFRMKVRTIRLRDRLLAPDHRLWRVLNHFQLASASQKHVWWRLNSSYAQNAWSEGAIWRSSRAVYMAKEKASHRGGEWWGWSLYRCDLPKHYGVARPKRLLLCVAVGTCLVHVRQINRPSEAFLKLAITRGTTEHDQRSNGWLQRNYSSPSFRNCVQTQETNSRYFSIIVDQDWGREGSGNQRFCFKLRYARPTGG